MGLLCLAVQVFSKIYSSSFHSASWHQHVQIGFFPLAFWVNTNFGMGLLSLSLVSQKFIGARFAQPHYIVINILIGFVSLGLLGPNKI